MPQTVRRATVESPPPPRLVPGRDSTAGTGLLQLEWDARGPIAMLAVIGELDLVSAPHLREALEHLIRGSSTRLVVDLSEVSFMDCSGVNALVAARRLLPAGGWFGVVCDEKGLPWRVLDLTGTRQAIPLFASLAAAVASAPALGGSADRTAP